jgi:phosphate transport system substrate-binding protein
MRSVFGSICGIFVLAVGCLVLSMAGCGDGSAPSKPGQGGAAAGLEGTITIDGSSTVFPITQAMAEDFEKLNPKVRIGVGKSGTGGGFKKFVLGETDISDASRPITDAEKEKCKEHGIEYVELKIAIDGISVVVNPQNTWCDCLSIDQLKAIWEPESAIKNWSDVNPAWPQEAISLYAPDPDSGTYDYFTEVVCKKKATRQDYQPNSEDQVLVKGVAGDKNALGYFGYAYYEPNKSKLKGLGIIPPGQTANAECKGAISPSKETIESGEYTPLARPLFLYANKKALQRPEVAAFLKYYLGAGQSVISEVKSIPLPADELQKSQAALNAAAGDTQGGK